VRERAGNRHPAAVPSGLYTTRDDEHVVLFAAPDHLFARLARALELPELERDPRFSSATARRKNADELEAALAVRIAQLPLTELLERLNAARVPVSKVNSIADVFANPQVIARENLVPVPDGRGGEVRMVGVLPKLSETPGEIRHAGRPLGADNDAVYAELGLDPGQIAALRERGVI
jgi:formyl-CoA transferase